MEALVELFTGAVVLCVMILLTAMCLSCRRLSVPSVIQPNYSSEDYTQPTPRMQVIRSYQPDTSWAMPSSSLSPISLTEQIARHNSFTPIENESLPSYENPGEAESEDEEGMEAPYVDVLPDSPVIETRQSTQTLTSTQSSDSEPPYVNVIEREQEDYQNVEPQNAGSCDEMTSDEDSDDEANNYVNQEPMSEIELFV